MPLGFQNAVLSPAPVTLAPVGWPIFAGRQQDSDTAVDILCRSPHEITNGMPRGVTPAQHCHAVALSKVQPSGDFPNCFLLHGVWLPHRGVRLLVSRSLGLATHPRWLDVPADAVR